MSAGRQAKQADAASGNAGQLKMHIRNVVSPSGPRGAVTDNKLSWAEQRAAYWHGTHYGHATD
jgi:hypothetical protein